MNIPGLIVSTILIGIVAPIVYTYWLNPRVYRQRIGSLKNKTDKNILELIYYPMIQFIGDNPNVSIWGGRIVGIIVLIILLMMLIVSIRGPFQG